MAMLRIRMLGRLELLQGDHNLTQRLSKKAAHILCYSLTSAAQPLRREFLAELVSDGRNETQAKKALRQALWLVQSVTAEASEQHTGILHADGEWVWINPDYQYWLDIAEFERLGQLALKAGPDSINADAVRKLERAAKLYCGGFLEGWDEDWCLFERERLQNLHLLILTRLIEYCESERDFVSGIAYASRALRHDPAHEQVHQRLIRLYAAMGDRAAALRQYKQLVNALTKELGVPPSAASLQLFRQITADTGGTAFDPSLAVREIMNCITVLSAELDKFQRELGQDIQA